MKTFGLFKKHYKQLLIILILVVIAFVPKDKLLKKTPENPTIVDSGMLDASGNVLEKSKLVLNSSNFAVELTDILYYAELYEGAEIELEGFVERKAGFDKHEFMISRLVISCCISEAENMGILCTWDNSQNLSVDQWVKATGVIKIIEEKIGDGQVRSLPLVIIKDLKKIKEPQNPYVRL